MSIHSWTILSLTKVKDKIIQLCILILAELKESNNSLLTNLQLKLLDTTTAQLEGGGRKILNIDKTMC